MREVLTSAVIEAIHRIYDKDQNVGMNSYNLTVGPEAFSRLLHENLSVLSMYHPGANGQSNCEFMGYKIVRVYDQGAQHIALTPKEGSPPYMRRYTISGLRGLRDHVQRVLDDKAEDERLARVGSWDVSVGGDYSVFHESTPDGRVVRYPVRTELTIPPKGGKP